MKKDIGTLDTADALDEIAALRPVAFTWKKTGVEDMGLIAQEVDPVFPELVTHSGADETLALKYTSLIAPMIASIQKLKKRDDELEDRERGSPPRLRGLQARSSLIANVATRARPCPEERAFGRVRTHKGRRVTGQGCN